MIALVGVLACPRAFGYGEESWPTVKSAHFVIHYEAATLQKGFSKRIEGIHDHLRRELWTISPWMSSENVHVYLYSSRMTYAAGRFHPPPWSGGISVYPTFPGEPKNLAVFEPVDYPILAHELTHLYFDYSFVQKSRLPPRWLNEGLATMIQGDAMGGKLPAAPPMDMGQFLYYIPGNDDPINFVSQWYLQAESVVRFLKRTFPSMYFTRFCKALADGTSSPAALEKFYGFQDAAALQDAWLKWRANPAQAARKKISPVQ
jgi:hypothetical protein